MRVEIKICDISREYENLFSVLGVERAIHILIIRDLVNDEAFVGDEVSGDNKDVYKRQVVCYMYSVEWQKKWLPHAHILLWLEEKIRPDQIDSVISAELPDPDKHPELYDIVKTHMIHGSCGTINAQSVSYTHLDVYKRQAPFIFV